MGTIITDDGTTIFYKDWGTGQPVVFSHGWPLNADAWDDQAMLVADHGFRAIAHVWPRSPRSRTSSTPTCSPSFAADRPACPVRPSA
jgi:pimeloyl-ACP methyl ester carboxylesterase